MTDRETETDTKLKAELDALITHFERRDLCIDDAAVLMAVSVGQYMKTGEPDTTERYNKLVELASTMMASGGVTQRPKRAGRFKLN